MLGFRGALLPLAAVGLMATPARANSVATEPAPKQEPTVRAHLVVTGDTLWDIARKYGCMPEDLKRENKIRSNMIHPGKKLKIPRCSDQAPRVAETTETGETGETSETSETETPRDSKHQIKGMLFHEVVTGDTLFNIAKKYDTSVDDLKLRNGIDSNMIRPGQQLDLVPGSGKSGRALKGQSVGRAHSGRLVSATRLTKGQGYTIRRPERAFGTNHAVYAIKRAVGVVRGRHPKVHALAIGDISAKKGGKITQHRSHQSGRDVDLGLYFKKKPKSYPDNFVQGTKSNLNFKATWTLLSTFSGMADADNGVERIFLDYGVQKLLHGWAKDEGVSANTLRKMFQYPHGKSSPTGLIRHEPGHADHLHIRFKCPKGDKECI